MCRRRHPSHGLHCDGESIGDWSNCREKTHREGRGGEVDTHVWHEAVVHMVKGNARPK